MSATQTGTAQVQGELWSARADDWAEVHEHNMGPAYEAVLDLAHAGPGVSLLEVGCGSGTALRMAADRGAHVTALDASPAFVEHARRRVPGADVRVGDLQFLPYEDAAFDAVVGFNSFQYAADVHAALGEARRVLRDGGRLGAMVIASRRSTEAPGRREAQAARRVGSSTSQRRRVALSTASARECAPSLRSTCLTWLLTVSTVR
jgi:ubiquinone/menaquinone biosynthesis C-methylase UbiE